MYSVSMAVHVQASVDTLKYSSEKNEFLATLLE